MAQPEALQHSLYQFFGPGGVLSRTHPAYEFRPGQLQMAQAVEEALRQKRHLIVEAGTGTGKTLAYLVPVLRAGRRVIISTATKALQEQLFCKDVPFLEAAIFPRGDHKLSVCYMKGRNNYLCRKKLYELAAQPILTGLEEIEQFRIIRDWEKSTETGDRAELAGLPEGSRLWDKLDARAEACLGQKCSEFQRCFITEMRRRAAASDIIIVNHHLFFADLAIHLAAEEAADAGVLPECSAVIFDEAHELENVATSFFGVSVSNFRFEELVRDTEIMLRRHKLDGRGIVKAGGLLRESAQELFSLLPRGEGRFEFANRPAFLEEHGAAYLEVKRRLDHLQAAIQVLRDKPDEAHNLLRRIDELGVQLSFVLEHEDRNTVFWIERRGGESSRRRRPGGEAAPASSSRFVFLQATPIDVSPILRKALFEPLESVVLTSATLAVNGGYEYVKRRLGVPPAREIVVPSHFDYARQALLYVPPTPDPRHPDFPRSATEQIRAVLAVTRGRAFCLFTSYAQMHDVYERLLGELDFPLLLQGQAPKNALLEEFRSTPHCVLLATASFWQGVDVQGEQLSCVIIDRLPFAVPSDPVVAARSRAIDESGGNAFLEYQVPAAVIALKQGFGRLIRSLHDRGVLVLLDPRVLTKYYGRVFLDSLPPYGRAKELADVEKFFAGP
jgi:ATP-dependent DNA helicase DinG